MIFYIENWMDQWRKSKLSIFQYSGLREMSPNNNHNWLTKFHSVSVILQFWKTEGRDLEILWLRLLALGNIRTLEMKFIW